MLPIFVIHVITALQVRMMRDAAANLDIPATSTSAQDEVNRAHPELMDVLPTVAFRPMDLRLK